MTCFKALIAALTSFRLISVEFDLRSQLKDRILEVIADVKSGSVAIEIVGLEQPPSRVLVASNLATFLELDNSIWFRSSELLLIADCMQELLGERNVCTTIY